MIMRCAPVSCPRSAWLQRLRQGIPAAACRVKAKTRIGDVHSYAAFLTRLRRLQAMLPLSEDILHDQAAALQLEAALMQGGQLLASAADFFQVCIVVTASDIPDSSASVDALAWPFMRTYGDKSALVRA
jgi:hypothetical protein